MDQIHRKGLGVLKTSETVRMLDPTPRESQPPRSPASPDECAMQALSPRQRATLDYIREHLAERQVIPTRSEIARGLGISHVSTVDSHLNALMRKGFCEITPGSPRNIRLLRENLPVVIAGPIAAGEPILAEGRVTAHLPRSARELFSPPSGLLSARRRLEHGQAGAAHRDHRRGEGASRRGQRRRRVVARIEDEVTLKRFMRLSKRRVELRPESTDPEHRTIEVDLKSTELHIDGIAVGALIGSGFNLSEDTA